MLRTADKLTVSDNSGSRPVPDPTVLTTELTRREISGLKELLETRLNGMDTAITLVHEAAGKLPTLITEKILTLRELAEEKFRSIEKQFVERDIRTEQTARDSKVAVDAALQAQKEAAGAQNESNAASISKSEAAFTKQIDQTGVLLATTSKASDEKIDDLKERLTALESRNLQTRDSKDESRGSLGSSLAVTAIAISAIGLLMAAITLFVLLSQHRG